MRIRFLNFQMNKKTIIITYFILFSLAYIPDLITTIIALGLGAVEINPIANYLFSVGTYSGVFLVFIFTYILAFIMLVLVEIVYAVYKKWFKEDLRFYGILLAVVLLLVFWQETQMVISNINVILSMKGG